MQTLFKLQNFYYWENRIKNSYSIFQERIGNTKIDKDSVIIYVGILDMEKKILRNGWSSHENVDMALGFLQYVFLPASFYTWIDRKSEGFYIPMSPFDILKDEVLKYQDDSRSIADAIIIEKHYHYLNSLWGATEEEKIKRLEMFSYDFNLEWDREPEIKLFARIFHDCEDISEFILENSDGEFEEIIEEEISMTIDDLKFMCRNVYREPLLNRNFINILNDRIPICF